MREIPLLVDTKSLPEFFKEKVSKSLNHLRIEASPDAEYYLVQLLTSFAQSQKLYEQDEKGEIIDKALALRLFDAMLATPSEKIPIFKKMGDIALYVSGFFADSFFRKIVKADYYIHMGEAAYLSASQLLNNDSKKTLKELFEELSSRFTKFVDVLTDVAESAHLQSDQSLLKLYERWLKTGSERTRDLLLQAGVVPNHLIKTGYTQ